MAGSAENEPVFIVHATKKLLAADQDAGAVGNATQPGRDGALPQQFVPRPSACRRAMGPAAIVCFRYRSRPRQDVDAGVQMDAQRPAGQLHHASPRTHTLAKVPSRTRSARAGRPTDHVTRSQSVCPDQSRADEGTRRFAVAGHRFMPRQIPADDRQANQLTGRACRDEALPPARGTGATRPRGSYAAAGTSRLTMAVALRTRAAITGYGSRSQQRRLGMALQA